MLSLNVNLIGHPQHRLRFAIDPQTTLADLLRKANKKLAKQISYKVGQMALVQY